jgi:hypothetical protein
MKSLGLSSSKLSRTTISLKDLWTEKWESCWLWSKELTPCTNMHRSSIVSASMEDITRTLMPRRWNVSAMVSMVTCTKG